MARTGHPARQALLSRYDDAARGRVVGIDRNCTRAYAPVDLTASAYLVSVATGGNVSLRIDAGSAFSGRAYYLLGCVDGSGPRGMKSGGVTFLLYPDPYFWLTAQLPNTLIRNSLGQLDATGKAIATNCVPKLSTTLVGLRFYHAYVSFASKIDYASTPVPLTLVK